ncbi:MAG TPA: hypothetical protein VHA55_12005 [Pseudorhodoplanes sp.]|jgi:hypothetical protein|nr:hypothetical protein [Pseudorhodoplanes sp.]
MRLFQRRTERSFLGAVLIALVGGALGGCSDIYYDRRDSISLASGDAVNANKVVQMVDPWPAHSVNRNIAFNGEKMQTAVERYRTGRIIPPVNATTSSVAYQQAQQAANSSAAGTPSSGGGSWSPPPTPSVK